MYNVVPRLKARVEHSASRKRVRVGRAPDNFCLAFLEQLEVKRPLGRALHRRVEPSVGLRECDDRVGELVNAERVWKIGRLRE